MSRDNDGCTPWTFVLVGLLFLAVMGPALVNVILVRSNAPEARVYALPQTRQGHSWTLIDGMWFWSEDRDDDGRPDCLRREAGGDQPCAVTPGPELQEALARVAAYKLERGWLPVTVIDPDRDGLADCVVDHGTRGVILRRTGTACPGDEYSIPAPLEDHPRRVELEELFARENEVRALIRGMAAG